MNHTTKHLWCCPQLTSHPYVDSTHLDEEGTVDNSARPAPVSTAPAGSMGGSSADWTDSRTVTTRLVSAKVGRRVVNGTDRIRRSALSSTGCSPPNKAAALLDGACTKISVVPCSLAFQACRVSWISRSRAACAQEHEQKVMHWPQSCNEVNTWHADEMWLGSTEYAHLIVPPQRRPG